MATFPDIIYVGFGQSGKTLNVYVVADDSAAPVPVLGPISMNELAAFPGIYWGRIPTWNSTWLCPAAIVEDASLTGLPAAYTLAKVVQIGNVVTVDGLQVLQVADPTITQQIVVQGPATVVSPVDPSDDDRLTLVQGDDYDVAGNIPSWSISGYTGPSLAGGTGKLRLVPSADYNRDGPDAAAQLIVDAAVVQAGTDLTVTAPITAAQVLTLNSTPPFDVDTHQYQLIGITSAGKSKTLRLSPATVRRRVKP